MSTQLNRRALVAGAAALPAIAPLRRAFSNDPLGGSCDQGIKGDFGVENAGGPK
jgi:hypothetical protein